MSKRDGLVFILATFGLVCLLAAPNGVRWAYIPGIGITTLLAWLVFIKEWRFQGKRKRRRA